MKPTVRRERNAADYGYPSADIKALSEKAIKVTQRLTEYYGEVPFSSKIKSRYKFGDLLNGFHDDILSNLLGNRVHVLVGEGRNKVSGDTRRIEREP